MRWPLACNRRRTVVGSTRPILLLLLLTVLGAVSAGSLPKEFCRIDRLQSDGGELLLNVLFPLRQSIADRSSDEYAKFNQQQQRRTKDPLGPYQESKICGPISKHGLQTLTAIDWTINILNSRSGQLFGESIKESFIPGVKFGYRLFDSCGLENAAISRLIDPDGSSLLQSCSSNGTLYSGAIFESESLKELTQSVAHLKRYSKPLMAQMPTPNSLQLDLLYGNLFSTLPTIAQIAEAMVRTARQLSWTHIALVYEQSDYGLEGKRQLLRSATDNDLCVIDSFGLPPKSDRLHQQQQQQHDETENDEQSGREQRRRNLAQITRKLLENLPEASAVFVFASETSSVELLQVAGNTSKQANKLRWILSDFLKDSFQFASLSSARGLFAAAPDFPGDVPELREHLQKLNVKKSNIWIKEFYQQTLRCRLPDETNPELAKFPGCIRRTAPTLGDVDIDLLINPYVISTIDGVYAYAVALRKAWELKCRSRPGICAQLAEMNSEEFLDIMKNVEFVYDSTIRAPPSLFGRRISFRNPASAAVAVYELVEQDDQLMFMEAFLYDRRQLRPVSKPIFYNDNEEVRGQHDGGEEAEPTAPPSVCPSKSGQCVCLNLAPKSSGGVDRLYKTGDLLLAGFFPVHANNPGGGCGEVRSRDGYQLAEAFWYALEKVNSKLGVFADTLRNVRLGWTAYDTCSNPNRASYLLGRLLNDEELAGYHSPSSTERLDDLYGYPGHNDRGQPIETRDLIGVIGELNDQITDELNSALRFANVGQLSYGARGVRLSDADNHPYLLRTIVSDASRLKMTWAALRQLGWNYVQIVASQSDYGRSMSRALRAEASDRNVCIAQSLIINSNLSNIDQVAEALGRKSSVVTVIFAEKRELIALLEQLRHRSIVGLPMITPDFWFNDRELLRYADVVDGSISFAARRLANQHFQEYIKSKTVDENEHNPWLLEYIEANLHCNFPGTSTRQYSAVCNPNVGLKQIPGFRPDVNANDVINAVYAFAFGLHSMLIDYCGQDYDGLCSQFRSLPNRSAILFEHVRRANFQDETGRLFAFDDVGDALTPVVVFQIRADNSSAYQYAQAGMYADSSNANILKRSTVRYSTRRFSSKCSEDNGMDGLPTCGECSFGGLKLLNETESYINPRAVITPSSTNKQQHPSSGQSDQDQTSTRATLLYEPTTDKISLAALFPVHHLSPNGSCGLVSETGVLTVEAFLWALEAVNANADLLRFQLGAWIMDTCSDPGVTSRDLGRLYSNVGPTAFRTYINGSLTSTTFDRAELVAFLHRDDAWSPSVQLLNAVNATNLAVDSSSDSFGDLHLTPYTLRTSSPMFMQISAILSLLERMNWTYVSVVYSGQRWGLDAYLRLKSDAADRGICIATAQSVTSTDQDNRLDAIWTGLRSANAAPVVVLLVDFDEAAALLLQQAKSTTKSPADRRPLTLIGSSSWGDLVPFARGEEQAALGALLFQHDSQPVDAFAAYLESLTFDTNDRNPWWREFWRQKFNCNGGEDCVAYGLTSETVRNRNLYTNVMNSVWAVAAGLGALQQEFCGSAEPAAAGNDGTIRHQKRLPCRMHENPNFKQRLFEAIKSAGFARVDNPQEHFRFSDGGWSDSGLYVLNLIKDETDDALEYKAVGKFHRDTLELSEIPLGYIGDNNARSPLSQLRSVCEDSTKCPQCPQRRNDVPSVSLTANISTFAAKDPQENQINNSDNTTGTSTETAVSNDAFLYAPASSSSSSAGRFLLLAVLPLHERGHKPLSCGRIKPEQYQNLQALLWSMKAVHADQALSANANMETLVFDTCSDVSKGLRDLSNFLSGQVAFRTSSGERIDPNRTLAAVNSALTREALPLAQLLTAYSVPNVSPGMSASMFTLADAYRAEFSLRTSVPTDVQARCMASVLSRMGWTAVSVLYTDNIWGINGEADFRTEAEQRGICIVISEPVPESDQANCTDFATKIDETVARLLAVRNAGSRAVIVWLSEESTRCLLFGLKRAVERKLMSSGDLTLFFSADLADLHTSVLDEFSAETAGFLALQYTASTVESFRDYWQSLSGDVGAASGHLWSKEFFRRSQPPTDDYRQNAYLLNTVNAVFSVAVGLENYARSVCNNGRNDTAKGSSICPEMVNDAQFRLQLYDSVRSVEFDDVTGRPFRFAHSSFSAQGLAIMNLIKDERQQFEIQHIGLYEADHLKLRTPPQGFDQQTQIWFNLRDRVSQCENAPLCNLCDRRRSGNDSSPFGQTFRVAPTASYDERHGGFVAESPAFGGGPTVNHIRIANDLAVINPSKRFSVMGVFPVHRSASMVSCGEFNSLNGFQRMAAFMYAINEINRDPYILPGIELGAVAIDDCASETRALTDVFELLASNSTWKAEDFVGVVGLEYNNGETELDAFLRKMRLPIVTTSLTPMSLRDHPLTLSAMPSDELQAKVMADVFRQMKWTYFSVLYEPSEVFEPTAKMFERLMVARGGCVARSLPLKAQPTLEDAQVAVRQLVVVSGAKAVAIFLSDRSMLTLIKAILIERVPPNRFILVTRFGEDWAQDDEFGSMLPTFGQALMTVEMFRRNSTNFANFMASLTLHEHSPLPTGWFEQFWQHKFQCTLPDSRWPDGRWSTPCSGEERLTPDSVQQGASVLPTILAVQGLARGLHRFLMQNCPTKSTESLADCVGQSADDPRDLLTTAVRGVNFSYVYETDKPPETVIFGQGASADLPYVVRYLVKRPESDFRAREVGLWRAQTGLLLDTNQILFYEPSSGDPRSPTSVCLGDLCSKCLLVQADQGNWSSPTIAVASASLHFKNVWGVVIASVAALGMLTCVVCIIYFLMTFPISYGTTVLGYMILFGLMVLYALAFAFTVAPTGVSCSIRRFCTGICWALVFAPMLIKVVHAWNMRAYDGKLQSQLEHMTSPCALFSLAVGIACVQLVIAVEWVLLQSPDALTYVTSYRGVPLSPHNANLGLWRCGPGEQFEAMLVASNVYVMFLIFLTTVFSLLTWNVDEHGRESRWIFASCLITITVWLSSSIVSTRSEYKVRDPAIAIGIVVNATAVLLCLYLRKVYLYSKYRQKNKEVMYDTQSAVYLASTLAATGPYLAENTDYYDNKMTMMANGNGRYVGGGHTTLSDHQPIMQRMTLPPLSSTDTTANGACLETRTMFYANAAFNGAVCERVVNDQTSTAANGTSVYARSRASSTCAGPTPNNHRF